MNSAEWSDHIIKSVQEAVRGHSRLDTATRAVEGFSPPTLRHLYNNLCSPEGFAYLEIGLWFGASFTAACCYNTSLAAYGVENFAQPFHRTGVRETLLRNLEIVRPKTGKLTFIEQDCWSCDQSLIDKPVDLFLYDGSHDEESQFKALPHFFSRMADIFLFAIDDWNWQSVNKGTLDSLVTLKDKVRTIKSWTWHTAQDDPNFHNGLALFLLQKM